MLGITAEIGQYRTFGAAKCTRLLPANELEDLLAVLTSLGLSDGYLSLVVNSLRYESQVFLTKNFERVHFG